MGSFKNHVDTISLIFDHPPTSVDTFYVLNMDKNCKFLTAHPPPIVHVVFEWPLTQGLLQYGPITELIFWKSYLETKSSKVLVISFEHLQKLCIFAKFGRHSSKIEPATPISISKCFGRKFKFERTKSLQILSKVVSYCDLQLVKIWCWYLKPLLINSKITNFALTF